MAGMLAAVAGGAPPVAAVAVACTLGATALSLAIQAGALRRRLRGMLPGPRAFAPRGWTRTALPIALIDLAGSGFNFADVLVLGFLLPPAEVGLYFAATRLVQLVVFVHYAASAVSAPRFAEAGARGDRAALARLVRHRARLTFLGVLAAALGVLAAAPLLLGLFGAGFRDGWPLLALLAAGHVLAGAFGPADDVLTMLGAERLCAAITLTVLALAVALMLVLVPTFGVFGAAVSAALAVALRGLALAVAARRRLGLATPVFARGLA
jgi:O-antigen/teichoic acid export membrane protein